MFSSNNRNKFTVQSEQQRVALPSTSPQPDPIFTYESSFQNTIFSSRLPAKMNVHDQGNPVYQRFTATGRPLPSSAYNTDNGLSGGLAGMESLGASAPNHLPVRFTDESIISVPVLPSAEPSQLKPADEGSDQDSVQDSSKSKSSRFSISGFRRKSSSGNTKKSKSQDFVIKKMTRAEYLEHYAKDDDGKYIGTLEPALDCILNNAEDRLKWRRG